MRLPRSSANFVTPADVLRREGEHQFEALNYHDDAWVQRGKADIDIGNRETILTISLEVTARSMHGMSMRRKLS